MSLIPRRTALRTGGLAALAGLTGCLGDFRDEFQPHRYVADADLSGGPRDPWPMLGHDARRTSHRSEGPDLTDAGVTLLADAGRYFRLPPVVAGETCYFGVDRRPPDEFTGFLAVDAERGTESWRLPINAGHTPPTVVGETAVLTAAGETRAVDRATGDLRWRYADGDGYPEASPVVTDGVCYVPTDRVTALDAVTGERLWETDEFGGLSSIAVTDETVYTTTSEPDPGCVAFDATDGRVRWQNGSAGASQAVPVVADDRVVVVGESGTVAALSRAGETVWRRGLDPQLHTPVAVADRTAYLAADDDDSLSAFALADGTRRWRRPLGPTVDRTPAVADDVVYGVGWDRETRSDAIVAFDPATGEERTRVPLGADATSGVAVGSEALFVSVERSQVGDNESPHAVLRVS